jgi:4-aminobutyrate aminotransferase-like enzyme
LVARSGAIGAELKAGLEALVPAGVEVRGQGLMVGVDLSSRPGTAPAVAERLRENGVLVGTTGPGGEVLKIRPPLIWEPEHVEYFLEAFERTALA